MRQVDVNVVVVAADDADVVVVVRRTMLIPRFYAFEIQQIVEIDTFKRTNWLYNNRNTIAQDEKWKNTLMKLLLLIIFLSLTKTLWTDWL